MDKTVYKIAACIVTYKNPYEEVVRAANSFLSCSLSSYLIIVDNESGDGYLDCLREKISAHFVQTGINKGFAFGHNIGILNAPECEYHLVMNPDTCTNPGAVEKIVAFMDENQDIGLVTPKILNRDGSIQSVYKQLPTVLDLVLRRLPAGLRSWPAIRKRLEWFEMKTADYSSVFPVPFISGCFMVFRKKLLDEIGGFDERFFMYFEDVDITRRISAKAKAVYFPDACVTHYWNGGARNDKKLSFIITKSACQYFQKWGWKWI